MNSHFSLLNLPGRVKDERLSLSIDDSALDYKSKKFIEKNINQKNILFDYYMLFFHQNSLLHQIP